MGAVTASSGAPSRRPRCVVLDGFTLTPHVPGAETPPDEPTWNALDALVELEVYGRTPPELVLERAGEAELVLTNKVVLDGHTVGALGRLRYVGVLATGTNVVDLEVARSAGVVVSNVPGYASESVVEHVFGLILELSLRIAEHARAVREGGWARAPDFCFRVGTTRELCGQSLGIVGMGAIGSRVAAVGHALGMLVLAAEQASMHESKHRRLPVRWLPLDELFARADILSLHCPLRPETERLVDARRLRLMKPSALLINTGRGGLVDEAALSEALRARRLAGAGLDVLSAEPPSSDHPLVGAPNCLVTPHIAWATTAARTRLMAAVVQNVRAFLEGRPVNVVTP
ncbi:MAG: D-2-hydroxyacid dehydrogenase [Polyangiaceae bacterium]|nr:D-2-hydroxyacid dehydrogenase [Polyangiaceae bacterium]